MRASACAHHNGHRGGQAQSAGTGNYQHGNAAPQGKLQSVSCEHPSGEGYGGDDHNRGHKDACDFICQPGNGRLGAACLLHHADNLGQCGIRTDFVGPEFQVALRADGGSGNRIPGELFHRDALSRERTLVNGGTAGKHRAVYGDLVSRPDNHRIPHVYLVHRYLYDLVLSADPGHLGAQVHQRPDGIAGLSLGSGFQEFSQGDQGQNHSGGLKIEVFAVELHRGHVSLVQRIGHTKQCRSAVDQGCQRAHGNQRVHIGSPVPQGRKATAIVHPVQVHNGKGQEKLQERRHQGAVIPARRRKPHHMAHGKVHQYHKAKGGTPNPRFHFFQRVLLLGRFFCRAFRYRCLIPGVFHSPDDAFRHLVIFRFHCHGPGQQVYLCSFHSGDRLGHLLHPGRAGGTGHACDLEFQFHTLPLFSFYYGVFFPKNQLRLFFR